MAHIAEMCPFIEPPDLKHARGEPLDGAPITAGGVAARMGVRGRSDPGSRPGREGRDSGRRDRAGDERGRRDDGRGAGLGRPRQPVESVLWLMRRGARGGRDDLCRGDLNADADCQGPGWGDRNMIGLGVGASVSVAVSPS